jgi:hypothetical protein
MYGTCTENIRNFLSRKISNLPDYTSKISLSCFRSAIFLYYLYIFDLINPDAERPI